MKKKKPRQRDKWLDELNFDAIDLNMKNVIVNSGLFPGLAEDIIAKKREKPPKGLYEEVFIS